MKIKDIMFKLAPAVKVIFEYGCKPLKKDFKEVDPKDVGCSEDKKVYKWDVNIPNNDSMLLVTEEEMEYLLMADAKIMSYVAGQEDVYATYDEILRFVARRMPEVISEGTKYERKEDN